MKIDDIICGRWYYGSSTAGNWCGKIDHIAGSAAVKKAEAVVESKKQAVEHEKLILSKYMEIFEYLTM